MARGPPHGLFDTYVDRAAALRESCVLYRPNILSGKPLTCILSPTNNSFFPNYLLKFRLTLYIIYYDTGFFKIYSDQQVAYVSTSDVYESFRDDLRIILAE